MEEQATQDQKWLQQIKKHPVATVLITLLAVVIALIVLVILGYIFNWDWTGLNATNITSTPQNITKTITYQSEKTLWDWLQLLIIPAVLAVAGYVINLTISRGEQEATKQRDKTEHEIAEDNQRESALQDYIDKMSELLLHEKLRESAEEDEVRKIARVRTLTVISRLDAYRKCSILQFLHESGLIVKDKSIIVLREANLSGANLSGANLREADLSMADLSMADLRGADLRGANLFGTYMSETNLSVAKLRNADLHGADLDGANLFIADLRGANLSEANLMGAKLRNADLSEANLMGAELLEANLTEAKVTTEQLSTAKSLKGATMPDGSIHP